MMFQQFALTLLLVLFIIVITVPPIVFLVLYIINKKQTQHSVLRNFPYSEQFHNCFVKDFPLILNHIFYNKIKFFDYIFY
jgi:hypothetical protein